MFLNWYRYYSLLSALITSVSAYPNFAVLQVQLVDISLEANEEAAPPVLRFTRNYVLLDFLTNCKNNAF